MAKPKSPTSSEAGRDLTVIDAPDDHDEPGGLIAAPPEGAIMAPEINPAARLFLDQATHRKPPPAKIPIIAIDHRDQQFVLPSGECVTEVAGYPVYMFQTRAYYEMPPKPGTKGQPPDCWSADTMVPHADSIKRQHPTCYGCPRDVFGSARDGKSKACGTKTWIFLVNQQFGGSPPMAALIAPPSSIRVLLGNRFSPGYFQRAQARHDAYEIVWSVFRLQKAGDVHCVIDPVMGPPLKDMVKVQALVDLRNKFVAFMDEMRGQQPVAEAEPASME